MLLAASIIFVLWTKNPLFSVLGLISIFVNTSFLLLTLNIEFIGLIYIVIYVGAICVLFLFVLMLLNLRQFDVKTKPVGFLSFLLSYLLFLFAFYFFINEETKSFTFILNIYEQYFNVAHLELIAIYFIERPFILIIMTLLLFLAVLSPLVVASARSVFVRKQELYFAFSRRTKTISLINGLLFFCIT